MTRPAGLQINAFQIVVTEDRMRAEARFPNWAHGPETTVDEILEALDRAGVKRGVKSRDRLAVMLEDLEFYEGVLTAANGLFPEKGRRERVRYAFAGEGAGHSADKKTAPNGKPGGMRAFDLTQENMAAVFGALSGGGMAFTSDLEEEGFEPALGLEAGVQHMQFVERAKQIEEGKKMDLKEVRSILSVRAGQVIAEIEEAGEGKAGWTVYGEELPAARGSRAAIQPGKNVRVSPDGRRYIALASGVPVLDGKKIHVDPVYRIEGNVDYSTGNVDFTGTVEVTGSIMDNFHVKTQGDLIVRGAVQAAWVECGGNVTVGGGILTRGVGSVKAKKDVRALFVEGSKVECERDVFVERDVVSSEIESGGSVKVGGKIVGGSMRAFKCVDAAVVGAPAQPPGRIQAGINFHKLREIESSERTLDETLDEILAIDDELAALKSAAKPTERMGERTKNRMAERIRLVGLKKSMELKIRRLKEKFVWHPAASVRVKEAIHPGCVVVICDSTFRVDQKMSDISVSENPTSKTIRFSVYTPL